MIERAKDADILAFSNPVSYTHLVNLLLRKGVFFMWNNFLITLSIMGKGMVGIFTVIIIISLVVALMGRLGAGKKEDENKAEK